MYPSGGKAKFSAAITPVFSVNMLMLGYTAIGNTKMWQYALWMWKMNRDKELITI